MLSHSEAVKKIEYKKNTFILALNSIDCLHGVSRREKLIILDNFAIYQSLSIRI